MSSDCCMLPRRKWGLVAASGGLMTTAAAMVGGCWFRKDHQRRHETAETHDQKICVTHTPQETSAHPSTPKTDQHEHAYSTWAAFDRFGVQGQGL